MLKHIPNVLTILRFFLIPFIIYYLVKDEYIYAFILLALSGLTDVLDGAIARKFNLITNLGKLLDPLADKLTQISILCTLLFKGIIPLWIVVIEMVWKSCNCIILFGNCSIINNKTIFFKHIF